MKRLALVVTLLFLGSLSAQESGSGIPLDDFKHILVQERGRIKPMDTYARSILLQLSSKSTYDRRPAVSWLAEVLFTPEKTHDYKVIRINNPEVIQALGIAQEEKFRYSFSQLQPQVNKLYELAVAASKIESDERTPVEKELIKVYSLITMYAQASRSFAFAAPHHDFAVNQSANKALLELDTGKTQMLVITDSPFSSIL